jgi:diguanylate cyclase (GGDEF)-like protein/PAS domain S-box-containing protein
VSPSVTRALGWAPDDLVGTIMSDLVHPDDLAWSAERRDRIYAGDAEAEAGGGFILRMRTRAGGYRWVKTTLTTHRTADGDVRGFTGGMVIVDDLIEARQQAMHSEALLRSVSDSLEESHTLLEPVRDDDGAIIEFLHRFANRAMCIEYGRSEEEMLGMTLQELEPGYDGTGLFEIYAQVADTGVPVVLDAFHYVNPVTGTDRHYDTRVTPVGDGNLSVVWRDVTDEHQAAVRLAESEQRYRLVAEHATDVIQLVRDGLVAWVSPSLENVLGWRAEEWVHRDFGEFIHPDDHEAMRSCRDAVEAGAIKMVDLRIRHGDGTYHWVNVAAKAFYDAAGARDGIVASLRVVDDQVAAREALAWQATHDPLTGVLNRTALLRRLDAPAERDGATGATGAMLFIDLDEFKAVNDTNGHVAGDLLLRAIAERLVRGVRAEDAVGRMGGDEFLVVLDGDVDEAAAVAIADELRRACSLAIETPAGAVSTTLSIGVVLRHPTESADALILRADAALYEAKRRGRDQTVVASA